MELAIDRASATSEAAFSKPATNDKKNKAEWSRIDAWHVRGVTIAHSMMVCSSVQVHIYLSRTAVILTISGATQHHVSLPVESNMAPLNWFITSVH